VPAVRIAILVMTDRICAECGWGSLIPNAFPPEERQMFGDILEKMLEEMFGDIDEPILGIEVLSLGRRRRIFTNCCTYNYATYGG
jgi:hypothetical protein